MNFIELEMCAVLKHSCSVENSFLLPAYYQVNIEQLIGDLFNYLRNYGLQTVRFQSQQHRYEMIYQLDAIEYLFVFFQLDMFLAYTPIFRSNGCYSFFTYAAYGVLGVVRCSATRHQHTHSSGPTPYYTKDTICCICKETVTPLLLKMGV